eukprot:666835-Pelagomonas_calceolata.AAC.1
MQGCLPQELGKLCRCMHSISTDPFVALSLSGHSKSMPEVGKVGVPLKTHTHMHTQVLTNDTPGMLAVSDDVDACVLHLTWPDHDLTPTVKHIYTIPALAYIAAGKTQRKHVLTGACNNSSCGLRSSIGAVCECISPELSVRCKDEAKAVATYLGNLYNNLLGLAWMHAGCCLA